MRTFASDNAAGAHPLVIEAISRVNAGHALAYGDDEETRSWAARIIEAQEGEIAEMEEWLAKNAR